GAGSIRRKNPASASRSSIRYSVNKQLRVVVGRGRCRHRWSIVSRLSCSGCRLDRRCSGRWRCAGSCAASAAPEASTSKGAGPCHDSDVLLAIEHEGHWWADAGTERQRYVEKLFTLVCGERFHVAVAQRLNHEVRSQRQRASTGLSSTECKPSFLLSGGIPRAENVATPFVDIRILELRPRWGPGCPRCFAARPVRIAAPVLAPCSRCGRFTSARAA